LRILAISRGCEEPFDAGSWNAAPKGIVWYVQLPAPWSGLFGYAILLSSLLHQLFERGLALFR
jgi:hypothetical protein